MTSNCKSKGKTRKTMLRLACKRLALPSIRRADYIGCF
nr:MAG TPA: hypothetical protein [Caudoviricetes sp.]